jgi:MFS family permease
MADAWSRRKVIAIAVGAWSFMTALCGVAQGFPQLLFARMGVGVGEAGGNPPCQALISDVFPRDVRSLATGVFLLSVPFGIGFGLLLGGWAVGEFGWRITFILAGIPGLILAPLIYFTIPEIQQGMADGLRTPRVSPPLFKTIRFVMSLPSFRNQMTGSSAGTFLSIGIAAWMPSFLSRSHGLTPAEIGVSLGFTVAAPQFFGLLIGGRLADVLGRRDMRWYFWMPSITGPMCFVLSAIGFLVPVPYVFICIGLSGFLASLHTGASPVVVQSLAPITFRTTVIAFWMFVVVLVGTGLGPQAVGIASDMLRPAYGERSLQMSLLFATSCHLLSGFFNFRGSRTYRKDLERVEAVNRASTG